MGSICDVSAQIETFKKCAKIGSVSGECFAPICAHVSQRYVHRALGFMIRSETNTNSIMLNTFWNATTIGVVTAMLAQRVLDAISADMVARAPKRENQSGNALFHARGRFPDIAQSEGRVWREVYNFSLARGRSHKVGSLWLKKPKFDFSSESEDFDLK